MQNVDICDDLLEDPEMPTLRAICREASRIYNDIKNGQVFQSNYSWPPYIK